MINENWKDSHKISLKRHSLSLRVDKSQLDKSSTVLKIIDIFQKSVKYRTLEDVLFISNYLYKTDLIQMFKNENVIDETELKNMLSSISTCLKYEKFEENTIIFNHGEEGDKFYLIIQGIVKVFKPLIKEYINTQCQYFKNLILLKEKKDLKLLENTIEKNKSNFPTHITDIDFINKSIYEHNIFSRLMGFVKILESKKIKPKNYELKNFPLFVESYRKFFDEAGIGFEIEEYDINFIVYFLEKCFKYSSEYFEIYHDLYIEHTKYNHSCNEGFKCKVYFYDYVELLRLTNNQCFGDLALISKAKKRTATLITETECHFAVINSSTYDQFISLERARLINKNISFLNRYPLFKSIDRDRFEKRYFTSFILKEYDRGQVIINEGSDLNYIYIVKEGDVELTISSSLIGLKRMINKLQIIEPKMQKIILEQDKIKDKLEEFNKKRLFSLYRLSNGDCFSLQEFVYNLNNLTKATIISNKAYIYHIDKNFLIKIKENEQQVYFRLRELALSKITFLYDRLIILEKTIAQKAINDLKFNIINMRKKENIKKNELEIIRSKIENIQIKEISKYKNEIESSRIRPSIQYLTKQMMKINRKSIKNLNYSDVPSIQISKVENSISIDDKIAEILDNTSNPITDILTVVVNSRRNNSIASKINYKDNLSSSYDIY